MSKVTPKISKEQSAQLENLGALVQLPTNEMLDLAVQILSAAIDASLLTIRQRSSQTTDFTVEEMINALKTTDTRIRNGAQSRTDTSDSGLTLQQVSHVKPTTIESQRTAHEAAAEAERAKKRRTRPGFNMMKGAPTVDGVTYQNELRDTW